MKEQGPHPDNRPQTGDILTLDLKRGCWVSPDEAAAFEEEEKKKEEGKEGERVKTKEGSKTREEGESGLNGTTSIDRRSWMNLVYIRGGEFLMGSPKSEKERRESEGPQTRVMLTKDFWMGETPVTQGQYRAIMGKNPSRFKGASNLPVEQVSWEDAMEFCRKMTKKINIFSGAGLQTGGAGLQTGGVGLQTVAPNHSVHRASLESNTRNAALENNIPENAALKSSATVSLPTEAQWEYACRAGTTTPFSFGETISTEQANYDGNYVYGNGVKGEYRGKTTPVKRFPPNPWGLYDMHGNVWEWCLDWYGDKLPGGKVVEWTGPKSGASRVCRGGSWYGYPLWLRSGDRFTYGPTYRDYFLGFRVVVLFSRP